jgi:hypothetical protein
MSRIYRVSGLRSAGSASVVARAISGLERAISVRVDVEGGYVSVKGSVSESMVAAAVKNSGCEYLGQIDQEIPDDTF